eukprot:scaffold67483_cov54-Phaeocystis_antarctica.AAC.1
MRCTSRKRRSTAEGCTWVGVRVRAGVRVSVRVKVGVRVRVRVRLGVRLRVRAAPRSAHLAQREHPLVDGAVIVRLGVEVLRVLPVDVGEHGGLEAVRLRLQQREGGGVELLAVEQLQLDG